MSAMRHESGDMCACGHNYAIHSYGEKGPCLASRGCGCAHFTEPEAGPVFTPDPLPAVETRTELDLAEALAWNGEVVRLLNLAVIGQVDLGNPATARVFELAAQIAIGVDKTAIMQSLLPESMWGEIDG